MAALRKGRGKDMVGGPVTAVPVNVDQGRDGIAGKINRKPEKFRGGVSIEA